VTLYLDTSNLVKLYVDEDGSGGVRHQVENAEILVTSIVAYAEVRATFARKRSEKLLTRTECSTVIRQFDLDWPRMMAIPVSRDLVLAAGRLADIHGVRGFDAVHLAAFEAVVAQADGEVHFSSADERLVKAAKKLG
jgi:predicted nucleic acid-binding protein